MKIFALALLALSLATPSFAADENMTVTAPRPSPGPTPSNFPGGAGPGRPDFEKQPKPIDGEGGTTKFPKKKELGGWKLGDQIQGVINGTITEILSRNISGEGTIYVKVETKEMTVTVWIQVKASSSKSGN